MAEKVERMDESWRKDGLQSHTKERSFVLFNIYPQIFSLVSLGPKANLRVPIKWPEVIEATDAWGSATETR